MMKDNVDKRVVEFEFDNSKFDKNVKKSTKTLNKLDETLQFKDVSKSLDAIEKKFSSLGVIAASVLKNLTDRVVNVGIRVAKSLSVDNIITGWDKFGQKTIAVGTLMSQSLKVAGREIENYSEKMDIVNDQLAKLNWFTDETSYNFTDMVDNIGKFTAAGQDLDKSVEAMMGIANWAALSGQNAATASRAMYQLSQALGKGYVQLIDWKSIQNANMDTQEFRQVVLDTAVALGELTKEGQNYISKTGKKFTKNQFAEQLNAKWFTSDVLTNSLKKYSAAVDKLYEITEREGITASEAIEKYGDQFDDFAIKAFKAAQEARTFADAINSVKDAVSTGWMKTAEYIFGGYEEAKKFWTDLANKLYDVFATSGEIRNRILEVWEALDGRTDLFTKDGDKQGAFWNLYDSIIAVRDVIKEAWNTIFPSSAFDTENDQVKELGHNLKTLTDGWRRATERLKEFLTNNETIRKIFTGLFSVIRVVVEAYELIRYALDPLIYTIREIGRVLIEFFASISNKFAEVSGQTNVFYDAATKVNEILTKIFTTVDIPGILRKVTGSLSSIVDIVKKVYDTVSNFFEKYIDIPKFIQNVSNGLKTLTSNIKNFFSQLKKGKEISSDALGGNTKRKSAKNETPGNEDNILSAITNGFNAEEYIDVLTVLKKFALSLLALLSKLYELVLGVIRIATTIVETIVTGLDVIISFLNKIAERDEKTLDILKNIATWALIGFIAVKLYMLVKNFGWMIAYVKANIFSFLDEITDAMQKRAMADIISSIGFDLLAISASFLIIIRGIEKISSLKISWEDIGKAGAIFGVLAGAAILLSLTTTKLSNQFKLLGKKQKGLERSYETSNVKQISGLLLSFGISFLLISKGLSQFKDFDKESFKRVMIVLGLLTGLCFGIQHFSKAASESTSSMRKMLPSIFQMIGFVLALKLLIKVINATASAAASMIYTAQGSLTLLFSGIIFFVLYLMLLGFVRINNLTKQASKEASKLSGNTLVLGSRLGAALIGVAAVISSVALFAYTMKSLGDNSTKILTWLASIIGGILIAVIGLQIIINVGNRKLAEAAGKNSLEATSKTISKTLFGIGALLLSISASLLILKLAFLNSDSQTISKMQGVLIGIGVFILVLFGAIIALSSILKNRRVAKSKSSLVATASAIPAILNSISILLLSIAAVVTVLSLLPNFNRVIAILAVLEVFVLSLMAIVAFIAQALRNTGNKTPKRAIALLISAITIIGVIVASILLLKNLSFMEMIKVVGVMSIALLSLIIFTKSFNKLTGASTKAKTVFKRLLALVPVLLMMASVVAAILLLKDVGLLDMIKVVGVLSLALLAMVGIAKIMSKTKVNVGNMLKVFAGMGMLSAGILSFALLLKPLANSISYITKKVKPNWEVFGYIAAFLGLFVGLSALVGYLPQIALGMLLVSAGILTALSSIGTGMVVLAWGLERLNPQIAKLKSDSVKNLKNLLLWLSLTGITGLFGIIGNSSLGVGMQVLGWGLSNLVGPMNKLTSTGVDNLHMLLLWLSLTGITGLFGIIGNSSLGVGMHVLGWGLGNLVGPMNSLTAEGLENFEKLFEILGIYSDDAVHNIPVFGQLVTTLEQAISSVANFFLMLSSGEQAASMALLGAGLSALVPSLRELSSVNLDNFKKLMDILFPKTKYDWDPTGLVGGLADVFNGLSGVITEGLRSVEYALRAAGMTELAVGLSSLIPALVMICTSDLDMDRISEFFDMLSDILTKSKLFDVSVWGAIKEALKNLFGGNDEMSRFAKALTIIGSGFKEIANAMAGIDNDKIKATISVGEALSSLMNAFKEFNTFEYKVVLLTQYINRLVNLFADVNANDSLTLRPVIDMTEFNNGYNRLTGMLSNISGSSFGFTASMASAISSDEQRRVTRNNAAQTTNNYNDSYNIVMNIESDNPQEIADELDRILQNKRSSAKAAKGGSY